MTLILSVHGPVNKKTQQNFSLENSHQEHYSQLCTRFCCVFFTKILFVLFVDLLRRYLGAMRVHVTLENWMTSCCTRNAQCPWTPCSTSLDLCAVGNSLIQDSVIAKCRAVCLQVFHRGNYRARLTTAVARSRRVGRRRLCITYLHVKPRPTDIQYYVTVLCVCLRAKHSWHRSVYY